MNVRRTVVGSTGVTALGLALLVSPLLDMWQDAAAGKPVLSTVAENLLFLAVSLGVVVAGRWLAHNDWERRYVRSAAAWALGGSVGVAAVFGAVVGIQLFVQQDLKPLIIAADGVVLGSLAAVSVGVYNARSERESDAFEAERDRFSALFDNTSDALVAFDYADGRVDVREVNDRFEGTFGLDADDAPLGERPDRLRLSGQESAEEARANCARVAAGDPFQMEVTRSTRSGSGGFVASVIPVGADDPEGGFVVFTDITAQRERERDLETLSEGSRALLSGTSAPDVVSAACALVGDLVDLDVVGVWSSTEARLDDVERSVAANRAEDTRTVVLSDVSGATADRLAAAVESGSPTRCDGSTLPELDRERTRAAGDGGVAVEVSDDGGGPTARSSSLSTTLLVPVGGSYLLCLGRAGDPFTDTERSLIDVFARNTEAAVERAERESRLAARTDQLEFLNSLLRHDIQNAMTIIRARGSALEADLDGQHAEYAATVVEQSDDVIDVVDRFRTLLDALTGERDAELVATALTPVVEERVDRLRGSVPDARVTTQLPDGDLDVVADAALPNVVDNVLTNAVEHNDSDDPRVHVEAETSAEAVTLRVADDGPGVPDDVKQAIFRRGTGGVEETEIGSGFGLFFVDTMMRRYGGSVRVRDRGAVDAASFDGGESTDADDRAGAVFELTFERA